MKVSKLTLAAAAAAAFFAVKAFFPFAAAEATERLGQIFSGDIDYVSVFSELGRSIGDREAESIEDEDGEIALLPVGAETGAVAVPLKAERGENEGESGEGKITEPPPAVAAFLESQEEFADYDLPVSVSYEYLDFPYEIAVPVAGYSSSGFGYRLHPIHGEIRFHYGSDFAAWSGEEILAFADGTVSFAGYCDSYGNYITIDHADGWQSLYAHCSELYMESGDKVEAGEKIALVGATGLVTGPHLHFELTKDGVYVNPEYYVN